MSSLCLAPSTLQQMFSRRRGGAGCLASAANIAATRPARSRQIIALVRPRGAHKPPGIMQTARVTLQHRLGCVLLGLQPTALVRAIHRRWLVVAGRERLLRTLGGRISGGKVAGRCRTPRDHPPQLCGAGTGFNLQRLDNDNCRYGSLQTAHGCDKALPKS